MINEIKEEILKISKYIEDNNINNLTGDEISRAVTRLAVLRVNLGQEFAQATGDYDFSYIARKIEYASQYNRFKAEATEKLTQKDLDSATIVSIGDMMKKEADNKFISDSLKILYDSSGTLISTLQTRLKVLENERREASKQV